MLRIVRVAHRRIVEGRHVREIGVRQDAAGTDLAERVAVVPAAAIGGVRRTEMLVRFGEADAAPPCSTATIAPTRPVVAKETHEPRQP
ncbi:MAG TPA: hypothetical protein VMI72_12880 [Roseiarcus sp.]|nr:hypothetical protein [Roseiarcus sp.]